MLMAVSIQRNTADQPDAAMRLVSASRFRPIDSLLFDFMCVGFKTFLLDGQQRAHFGQQRRLIARLAAGRQGLQFNHRPADHGAGIFKVVE